MINVEYITNLVFNPTQDEIDPNHASLPIHFPPTKWTLSLPLNLSCMLYSCFSFGSDYDQPACILFDCWEDTATWSWKAKVPYTHSIYISYQSPKFHLTLWLVGFVWNPPLFTVFDYQALIHLSNKEYVTFSSVLQVLFHSLMNYMVIYNDMLSL